jgi:hypothetical protein
MTLLKFTWILNVLLPLCSLAMTTFSHQQAVTDLIYCFPPVSGFWEWSDQEFSANIIYMLFKHNVVIVIKI